MKVFLCCFILTCSSAAVPAQSVKIKSASVPVAGFPVQPADSIIRLIPAPLMMTEDSVWITPPLSLPTVYLIIQPEKLIRQSGHLSLPQPSGINADHLQVTGSVLDHLDISAWLPGGTSGLQFSQSAYSNWATGGENSLAVTVIQNLYAHYRVMDFSSENSLEMAYGKMKQGTRSFRKSDDKLILLSKTSARIGENLNLAGLVDFRTQFAEGFKYLKSAGSDRESRILISDWMAPGYLSASVGVEYKPVPALSVILTPLTGRTTFVLNRALSDQGAFGVEKGRLARHDFGATFNSTFQAELVTNVSFSNKLNLFSEYRKMKNLVVNWETVTSIRANSFLRTTISTSLIYDDKVQVTRRDGSSGRDVQMKEVIAVGLAWDF